MNQAPGNGAADDGHPAIECSWLNLQPLPAHATHRTTENPYFS
jgi:hypothetical protein